MMVQLGTLLHIILNRFSNKTYSYRHVKISKLYTHVNARLCRLNRLDGTMTDLQDIHWAGRTVAQCISWRPVIMPYNLYIYTCISINQEPPTICCFMPNCQHINNDLNCELFVNICKSQINYHTDLQVAYTYMSPFKRTTCMCQVVSCWRTWEDLVWKRVPTTGNCYWGLEP